MNNVKMTASVICTDHLNIQRDLKETWDAGVTNFHIDVMDGQFVPRIGMYPEQVEKIREYFPDSTIDVHTMLIDPNKYLKNFIDAGADLIIVHAEAHKGIYSSLDLVKQSGKKFGIALNIGTPISAIEDIASYADLIMLMGFNPGILNQQLWAGLYKKILNIKTNYLTSECDIMIDGGVKMETLIDLSGRYEGTETYWPMYNKTTYLVGGTSTIYKPGKSISDNISYINSILGIN
jgi:ribulose-phosphate 3-epimerase